MTVTVRVSVKVADNAPRALAVITGETEAELTAKLSAALRQLAEEVDRWGTCLR